MPEEYKQFADRMRHKFGIDLSLYKETQMKRRLTTLRNKRGFHTFDDYYKSLRTDSALLEEFKERMTINVSEFFRNPKRWEILEKKILPLIIQQKQPLNIWSAACSTGEEAYSIALMMKLHFPHIRFHIQATDIDDTVLHKAKKAVYPEQSLKQLSPKMKATYFKAHNGFYQLNDNIKDMVTFKKHNLFKDPYPKNMDLILCRNVLIYFTDQAKNMIYNHLSDSLKSNGVLFVGSTEQIFTPQHFRFKLLHTFFYKKMEHV